MDEIILFIIEKLMQFVIFAFFTLNLFLLYKQIVKERKERDKMEEDNIPSLIFLMIIILINMMIALPRINLRSGISLMGTLALIVLIFGTPAILLIIMAITNVIEKWIRKVPKRRRYGIELAEREDADKYKFRMDVQRKIAHFALFFGIIIILKIATNILANRAPDELYGKTDGSTILINLTYPVPFYLRQSFIILAFYVLSSIFIIIETTRLSKHVHFPLHRTIQYTLRRSELDTIASYAYMAIGGLFASFVVPENIFLGIFSLVVFGDTAASSIGIKFGKHKISFNKDKSWEGAIAGLLTSIFTSIFFIGVAWAIAAGILFLVLDIFSNKIKVSDNITVPVFSVFLFFALYHLGLPCNPLFVI
ncbi:MAG: hypothetical protein ACTSU2_11275 [Promethearchaeota archaeon]